MIFYENRLLADGYHIISYLILVKNWERCLKISSASVVIGALRVNMSSTNVLSTHLSQMEFPTLTIGPVYLCFKGFLVVFFIFI